MAAGAVYEVASNDGTFLRPFAEGGMRVLGIDPAQNIADAASKAGIPTVADFFGTSCASRVVTAHGAADIILARNVLPHVPEPRDIVAGMAICLRDNGIGAIEFHRADTIVRELHYDSIYHEHVCYFSLRDVERLLDSAGLHAFDVDDSPISGGSWVIYFAKKRRPVTAALELARSTESRLRLDEGYTWHDFANRCHDHAREFTNLVREAATSGQRIIGYGASARSSTLLNYCGIGTRDLACIADKSPHKHGTIAPGSDLPIVAPATAFAQRPDRVALLAWNFRDEILEDMARDFQWRGPVLVPLPGKPNWINTQ